LRRILSNEPTEMIHGLCHSISVCLLKKVSYEKFHVALFFAHEIVDDCLQARISKNPRNFRIRIGYGYAKIFRRYESEIEK